MYSIVEWFDSKEVSAVPSSWLVDDGIGLWCYWPPSSSDGDRPIKKLWPPKSRWLKYRVQAIGKAGEWCSFSV
jgi:hypothetical protein